MPSTADLVLWFVLIPTAIAIAVGIAVGIVCFIAVAAKAVVDAVLRRSR